MRDHVDRRRELDVAADVVRMRVRIDDRGHRLLGDLLELFQNRLAPGGYLGINQRDALGGYERRGVSAAAAEDIHVVSDLIDLNGRAEGVCLAAPAAAKRDRKSTRLNSSHLGISYAVF